MNLTMTYRRSGGLAVLVAAAAVALAVLSGPGFSHAAGLGRRTRPAHAAGLAKRHRATKRARFAATNDSTGSLEQWAACERANGDPDQADPTVQHQVIYIAVPMRAIQNFDPTNAGAPCGQYLAAARTAVADGQPATHPGAGGQPVAGWGDNALYVQYANCMRANGYPTFPYPSGKIEPDGNESTDFNGTGIDPNSPAFLNGSANQTCGQQVGAPAWWINSWGPPGSVDVYPAGSNPNSPLPVGAPLAALKPAAAGAPAAAVAVAVAGGPIRRCAGSARPSFSPPRAVAAASGRAFARPGCTSGRRA